LSYINTINILTLNFAPLAKIIGAKGDA
jgi:hypothetical protein